MILKKKENLKIATILPYKENYSFEKASAASLWVAEFYKKSKFKKNNKIYGSTDLKKYLTPNYVNIKLKNINSRFKSTTKEYCEKLIDIVNNERFDIIEVHNRPLIFFNIVKIPVLEGLIFTFLIKSWEFLLRAVSTIKKALELISEGIL